MCIRDRKKLESWKPWSRGAAVTAEGQLQCSFLTIFSACSAPPRDIEVPNPSREALNRKVLECVQCVERSIGRADACCLPHRHHFVVSERQIRVTGDTSPPPAGGVYA